MSNFYSFLSCIHFFFYTHTNLILKFLYCILFFAVFGNPTYTVYLWNIYIFTISFICVVDFTVRYLNNKEFKLRYPLLNLFIVIVLAICLIILAYSILENFYILLDLAMYAISEIITGFIAKMLSASPRPSNPSGPGPVGGGGEDPGKRPGGGPGPFGCGGDKSTDYDSASDEDSQDNSTNNQHNEPKKGTRFKYTGGSVPGEPEQWEIDEEKKMRKRASSNKYAKSIKGKEAKAAYKASKKCK